MALFAFIPEYIYSADLWVEAEGFDNKGGWVVDQQFMDQMGSSYLMAHGMGQPVEDAETEINFDKTGVYHVYVRTYNWTSPWYNGEGPGKFRLKLNGETFSAVLGVTGDRWMWQKAGIVEVKQKKNRLALHDLSGFNGRCDAIYFTMDENDIPEVAVIDPEMMSSMPKGLTAATGMDALTHAIEGYTTKAAWEIPDMFHLEAIKLISRNLRGAVENTPEGREGMAMAQYIAGMGFSNVGLGIAHSIAHTLGAHYDTPHGVACAMMLPIVMEYNQEYTGERLREVARAMGVEGVDEMTQEEYRKAAIDAVKKLSADVGIPVKNDRIREEDLDVLAADAFADACCPGNPRDTSVEDLKELYRKIM